VYIERVPDTVQTDHIDWGFRVSGIYGENYRYTTTFGYGSYQLLGHNLVNGWDMPMVWGELFIPQIAQGMLIRAGRYISIPDTEAQLAPNNYMYSHSMTYAYDNYTNTGLITTTALTKNVFLTAGVSIGTDTAAWHIGQLVPNPDRIRSSQIPRCQGIRARSLRSWRVRFQTDSGNDDLYLVMAA